MASVATTTRTDEEIQRDVLDEFKWDARLQPNEIGVAVKNGIVSLMGSVDSYAKRWAAEEAAHRVKGVAAVVNDIEVRLPSIAERSDEDIAKAIVNALQWDAFVSIDKLDVTVSKGWVTLRGQVEWEYQRKDAERVTRRINGVRGVSNLVTVQPRLSPADVKAKIEQALLRSVETDAKRITVEVDGKRIILKGTVRSWAEREEAERAAWLAPGATAVDNRITISL